MVQVTLPGDCGNAPKIQFIRDFCVASARADIETVMSMVADDITLEILGYKTAKGKEAVEDLLTSDAGRSPVTELVLENIISHGSHGAANGTLTFADGGIVDFCNMYRFNSHSKNAKLKLVQTYSIVRK